jgi:hypothetical protein
MGVKRPYKMLRANVAPKKPGRLADGARTDSEAVAHDGSHESAGGHGENRQELLVATVFSAEVPLLSVGTTIRDTPHIFHIEVNSYSSSSDH